MAGFVYVMSNPAFPNLLKIGKSDRDPTVYIKKELETDGVPEPFSVEYYAFVIDPHQIEKQVHSYLKKQKKNKNRNFFQCSVFEAINIIKKFAKQTTKYEEYLTTYSGVQKQSLNKESCISIKFENGDKYFGECLNGLMHGQGSYIFANNNKYEGEWKDGKKNGKGTFIYAKGGKYEGEWKDGKQHGDGLLTYPDGEKYEGEWKFDKRDGKGTYTFSSGNKYEGDWKDGKKNGKGTFIYAKGGKYEGEWKDEKQHGKGTFIYAKGGKYEGEWKDGKTIFRLPKVLEVMGLAKSTIYLRIEQGLLTKPVSIGGNSVGWPANEISKINEARIAGKTDKLIRVLVAEMMQKRTNP